MDTDNIFENIKPKDIIKVASRNRIQNFAKYVRKDFVLKPFHKVYYSLLDMFAQGKIKKLIVQMPPQCGKSEGSSRMLPAFLLGLNPNLRICIGSYSTTIARDFNRDVQKIIDSAEYRELFPRTTISGSTGEKSELTYQRNSDVTEIVNCRGSLRAVGRGGALTSKTIDISILDDVYKDYAEGNSPVIRESAWKWYTSVVRTRLHNESQEIIVFTRWNEDDLIGRIEKGDEKIINIQKWSELNNIPFGAWIRINFEAIKESPQTELDQRQHGESLWEDRHSIKKLLAQKKLDPNQFQCLYQGNPSSAEGRLYHEFKTWINKTDYGTYVRSGCCIDVADSGADFLCAITYDIVKSAEEVFNEKTKRFEPLVFALVTDVEFTNENTEITNVTVPQLINRNGTQKVFIESNNGGSGFERVISKKVKAETCAYHQSANKESRILTNSAFVNAQIIMPFNWENRFPKFYESVTRFLHDFKANAHDDAADTLTAIVEKELLTNNVLPYGKSKRGVLIKN